MTESSSNSKKKTTKDGIFKEGSFHENKKANIERRTSVSYHGPLGYVSIGSTPESRRQKLAQFSCSLYFIMPASILCWNVTLLTLVYAAIYGSTISHTWSVVIAFLALYLGFIVAIDQSQRTGSRTPFLRGFRQWWNDSCDYLPLTLVKTADLPPATEEGASNNYLLGYHPHGIISVGCFGAFATDGARTLDLTKKPSTKKEDSKEGDDTVQRGFSSLFPGLDRRVVTLDSNFGTPFLREYFLSMGAVCSDKKTFRNVLAKRNSALVVVVGGASESLETQEGEINLVLGRRRGFVREAIMGHASLVPVVAFGENDVYHMVDTKGWKWIPLVQDFLKKCTGIAMPIFAGRSILFRDFGVMPERKPVVVVVGEPIPPPPLTTVKNPKDFHPQIDRKTDEPLNEDGKILKEHHAKYIKALETMYEKYKNAPWNIPGRNRRQSLKIIR